MLPTYSFYGFTLLFAMSSRAGAEPSAGAATIDFATFVRQVESQHPQANLDRLTVTKAAKAESAAGVLPDPELQLGRQYIPLGTNAPAMADDRSKLSPQWQATVSQSFPWPGSLSAAADASRVATKLAETEAHAASLTRRLAAAGLFIELVALSEQIAIHRASLADTAAVLKSTMTRVQHGLGTHHELIAVQNEASVHQLNLAALAADLENLKDHAAQMLGQDSANGLAFQLQWPDLADARQEAPDFTKAALELKRDQSLLQLAAERSRSLPHFMASGMLMQDDSGMRMGGVMAGVSLPVFSGPVRSAVSGEAAVTAAHTDGELAWHDKKKRLALLQNERREQVLAKTLLTLTQEIIPNDQQHLRIILNDYGQGRASFADVNTAREQVFNLRLAEVNAHREGLRAGLARERILAGLLDEDLDRPTPQVAEPGGAAAMLSGGAAMEQSGMGHKRGSSPAILPKPGGALTEPNDADESTRPKGMNGM